MTEYMASSNVCNEYKTRNILSLANRMQVLREYDSYLKKKPSFQSLAKKFDCSTRQIKNILRSRESISKSYKEAGDRAEEASRDEILRKRQEKIDFLGRVLYEYLQRVVYFNYAIDEEKVHKKALQIKECIAIENFQPNNGWFKQFKMTYGITDFDIESLRNNIQLTEAKRPHPSVIDMIQFVSRQEQKSQKTDINGNKRKRGRPSNLEKLKWQSQNLLEPKIIYETIDDDDDDEHNSGEYNDRGDGSDDVHAVLSPRQSHNTFHDKVMKEFSKPKPFSPILAMYRQPPSQKRKRSNSPLPDIGSADEALKHVKVLEEYAMLQDNYRAIGLLTQLEQIFKEKSKST